MKKRFLPLLLVLAPVLLWGATSWPSPTGYVNDFARVLSADESQALELLLTELEQKTGAEVSVVTVKEVEGGDIDGAAVGLFKAWGIGKRGKDNGVLILLSLQDRKDRIEVGYGLESVLTDGQTGVIRRRDMEPFFKQGDYGRGITEGTRAVARRIAESQGVSLVGQNPPSEDRDEGGLGFGGTILLFLFLFFLFYQLRRRTRGGFWGGGFYGGGWGSGGGGFGGGGGGFGGFGGGGSGGGGSSGSW